MIKGEFERVESLFTSSVQISFNNTPFNLMRKSRSELRIVFNAGIRMRLNMIEYKAFN